MQYQTEIELGSTYKDEITGFTGVADSVFFYMNGCVRVNLVSRNLHENKVVDNIFDTQTLKLIDTNIQRALKAKIRPPQPVGGSRPAPRRTGH